MGAAVFLLFSVLIMTYVCWIGEYHLLFFCADPWGISVMTEDVKDSFDSMNTKEWFFRLKKRKPCNLIQTLCIFLFYFIF